MIPALQIDHYTDLLKRFGPTHQAAEWGSAENQKLRFKILMEGLRPRISTESLLDIGCGPGDLCGDVWWGTAESVTYEGWDITPAMVQAAAKRHPYGKFVAQDVMEAPSEPQFDWVVASGIFTHYDRKFFDAAVQKMWALCRKGLFFNALSTWGTAPVPGEYQADPLRTVHLCKIRCSWNVVLRHDYRPHDFTVYCYR